MLNRILLLAVLVTPVGLAGCQDKDGGKMSITNEVASPAMKDAANPVVDGRATSSQGVQAEKVQPPRSDSVLYMIYRIDGDGATSYPIENGSVATYWYGHRFTLGGKQYYTGFAYNTREIHEAEGPDASFAGPADTVTLTAATFELVPDAGQPWKWLGSERWIGDFGSYDRANEIDEARKPIERAVGNDRYVLGIPTWSLEAGTRIYGYDVFVFNPGEKSQVDGRVWRYVGNVVSGEDNEASCGEPTGGEVACIKRQGSVTFLDGLHAGMPEIEVAYPDGGAGVRYRYSSESKSYIK